MIAPHKNQSCGKAFVASAFPVNGFENTCFDRQHQLSHFQIQESININITLYFISILRLHMYCINPRKQLLRALREDTLPEIKLYIKVHLKQLAAIDVVQSVHFGTWFSLI